METNESMQGNDMANICDTPTGDKGQRYEVRYHDGDGAEKVMGWTEHQDGGGLARSLAMHPVWKLSQIVDRNLGGRKT